MCKVSILTISSNLFNLIIFALISLFTLQISIVLISLLSILSVIFFLHKGQFSLFFNDNKIQLLQNSCLQLSIVLSLILS